MLFPVCNSLLCRIKGVFKRGVQGVQTPAEIFSFFLKSEGKEVERKRKKNEKGYTNSEILNSDIFGV